MYTFWSERELMHKSINVILYYILHLCFLLGSFKANFFSFERIIYQDLIQVQNYTSVSRANRKSLGCFLCVILSVSTIFTVNGNVLACTGKMLTAKAFPLCYYIILFYQAWYLYIDYPLFFPFFKKIIWKTFHLFMSWENNPVFSSVTAHFSDNPTGFSMTHLS